jgi:hypothetical protein
MLDTVVYIGYSEGGGKYEEAGFVVYRVGF